MVLFHQLKKPCSVLCFVEAFCLPLVSVGHHQNHYYILLHLNLELISSLLERFLSVVYQFGSECLPQCRTDDLLEAKKINTRPFSIYIARNWWVHPDGYQLPQVHIVGV